MPDSAQPPVSTSSEPPDFPAKQRDLFRETLRTLNEHKVPYAVAGAFSLHHHTGIWRFTKDLDIFLVPADVSRALECLKAEGMVCEVCDTVWLAKAKRDGFFVDLITGMSNAVITVDPSWIERATPATVLGIPTRMLPAEEVLVSKLFVMRRERYDGADIAHVIYATTGKLDWDRIIELTGEHWEILLSALVLYRYVYPAHSDYVPKHIWQKFLGDFSYALDHRDPKAPFRGSLVDDKMFAIDVDEWGMRNELEKRRAELTANGEDTSSV